MRAVSRGTIARMRQWATRSSRQTRERRSVRCAPATHEEQHATCHATAKVTAKARVSPACLLACQEASKLILYTPHESTQLAVYMCRRYCMEESVEGEVRVYPGRTRCRAPMGDP